MGFPTYTVKFAGVAVTAQQDFFEIVPADDKPIVIIYAELSQSTEVGDAQEEGLDVRWVSGNSSSGSGGSTFASIANSAGFATAGIGTPEINNTTKANTGTEKEYVVGNWNVRGQWIYQPTPEKYVVFSQADNRVCLRLGTTPADSITMSGYCVVMELC